MNNTFKFCRRAPKWVSTVQRGMTHDGLGKYLSQIIEKAPGPTADIVGILKDTKTDVVVSYLPVGSEMATKWYVEQILEAGCAFVNCIPVFIAREKYWQQRFERPRPAGHRRRHQVPGGRHHHPPGADPPVPRARRQAGAHQPAQLRRQHRFPEHAGARAPGVQEDLQDQRRHLQLDYDMGKKNIHIGPSDYVPWLDDRKWAYIRMEGRTFGDVPLNIEMKLEVWDSPNSAGVVIDAVRCAKLALDRGISGPLYAPASYFMKSPPEQYSDGEARAKTEAFIAGVNVRSAAWEPVSGDAATADEAELETPAHVATDTPPCDKPVPGDAATADAVEA